MFFVNIVFFLSKIHGHSEKMAVYFFGSIETFAVAESRRSDSLPQRGKVARRKP